MDASIFLLNGEQFIRELYRQLLKRDCDPEGLAYYMEQLRRGSSKYIITESILSSKECSSALNEREITELRKKIFPFRDRKSSWKNLFKQPGQAAAYEISEISNHLSHLSSKLDVLNNRLQELGNSISSPNDNFLKAEQLRETALTPEEAQKIVRCLAALS